MTVKHLQSVQRQHLSAAVATDPTVVHKFRTGFNECATEVSRYIGSLNGIDDGVRKRLVSHLSSCINGIQTHSVAPAAIPNPFSSSLVNTEDLNNNDSVPSTGTTPQLQNVPGLQLIPTRLPSGDLVLLLPNSSSLGSLFPNTLDLTSGFRSSAFTPVGSKDAKSSSSSPPSRIRDSGGGVGGDEPCVKYESSHSEVSSTSNDGSFFKTPSTSAICQSNASASSSLLIPVTELDPQTKRDQYGPSVVDRGAFKPLTVYTDPCYDFKNSLSPPVGDRSPEQRKSPLDFSVKKEPEETPSSTRSWSSRKRPLGDLPCNVQLPSKLARTELKGMSNEVAEDASAANGDMWRPW